jgi:cell division protein FtsL
MAFMYNKESYDMSLFETEVINEEEKEKEIKLKKEIEEEVKKEQIKRNKIENVIKGVACGAVVAVMLGCVIVKQAQLTELNQQIANANKKLEEQQSLYIQTQMKVESKYSSDVVEESAQSELGMSRADSY